MSVDRIATLDDVLKAEPIIRHHVSPAPLIRSYELEKELELGPGRRVWLKDFGWTPVGSFKLMGALAWMARHADQIGDRPVVGHSSGNFASGLAFAGERYGKKVIIVMPESAPKVKFERTRAFGADIRTYDIATDHQTGIRDRMTRAIAQEERAVEASPYDDNDVIAGNGVGGLEITQALAADGRSLSHFVAPVSGGGLLAGLALAVKGAFPSAQIIAAEPNHADDFCQSLEAGQPVRIEQPASICDGLLSYQVGAHNWPILKSHVDGALAISDDDTRAAMTWIYRHHGLRTEPSGAIAVAAARSGRIDLAGMGDVVLVLSGRNIDEDRFRAWTE